MKWNPWADGERPPVCVRLILWLLCGWPWRETGGPLAHVMHTVKGRAL